jgi:hypothetical protein
MLLLPCPCPRFARSFASPSLPYPANHNTTTQSNACCLSLCLISSQLHLQLEITIHHHSTVDPLCLRSAMTLQCKSGLNIGHQIQLGPRTSYRARYLPQVDIVVANSPKIPSGFGSSLSRLHNPYNTQILPVPAANHTFCGGPAPSPGPFLYCSWPHRRSLGFDFFRPPMLFHKLETRRPSPTAGEDFLMSSNPGSFFVTSHLF